MKCPECEKELIKDEVAFGIYLCRNCGNDWVIMTLEQSMKASDVILSNVSDITKFAADLYRQNFLMNQKESS